MANPNAAAETARKLEGFFNGLATDEKEIISEMVRESLSIRTIYGE
jgi:hypothetical protein